MTLHVVVGKGPVGTGTAELLAAQGHQVRVLSRSGGPTTGPVQHHAVDATDVGALTAATVDAATIYNAANPSYTRWATDWPPLAAALLTAAERSGAGLVTMGNLYGYGRPTGPMTPDAPLAATDTKGRVRARMWVEMVAAQTAGRARVTEARASDFLGPTVPPEQSHLLRQLAGIRKGRRSWVVGDPDVPRSWTAMSDIVALLAVLGTDDRGWGRAWMVPSQVRTQRDAVADLARAAGVPAPRVAGIPWPLLRAAGLAVPFAREVVDVRHQFDQEFVLDATLTTETFGLTPTPWEQTLSAAVAGSRA